MIKLLDKSRLSFFNYFFVFCFFVYAGKATIFARELGDIRTIGNAFALLLTIVFIIRNKIRFSNSFLITQIIFLVYALITVLIYHHLSLWWISLNVLCLTYAYVLCEGFKEKLFSVIETVLFHLAIISIIFWILFLISPNLVESIVKTFQFSATYSEGGNVEANMIIYTFPNLEYGSKEFNLWVRNPGFAWEPGAFASMLCLGLFCNRLRTNFRLSNNPAFWIFLIALVSTQSTTGLTIFGGMILLWLLENHKFRPIVIMIPLIGYIFTLPFVWDKIFFEYDKIGTLDIRTVAGPQGRFISLALDWEEFLRHPIWGLGCNFQNTWLNQHGYDISTISGIGELLSVYGGVITIIFSIVLIKSARLVDKTFGLNNPWIMIIVVVGMMISYNLWQSPIYIACWMYCIFRKK